MIYFCKVRQGDSRVAGLFSVDRPDLGPISCHGASGHVRVFTNTKPTLPITAILCYLLLLLTVRTFGKGVLVLSNLPGL